MSDLTGTGARTPETEDGSSQGPMVQLGPGGLVMAMTGLMLVLAMSTLDANIVGPALPHIVSDFGNVSHLSWVLTAFLLTATITTPLYGKLSDIYGRKMMFTISVGLFLVGSVLAGLSQSIPGLILGRAVQGLGGGGLMTLTQITISDLVPPRRRASYQGIFGAVFTLCSLIAPPLGGLITDLLSWRWIFYVNIPVGVLGIAIIWISIREAPRHSRQPIDYPGISVVALATTAALLALSFGGEVYAWHSPVILGLFLASGFLFMGLVAVERRSDNPIIEMRMFANQTFTVATVAGALITTATAGAMAFLPLFLQVVEGMTPVASGLMMTPVIGGLMIGLLVGGRLITKLGRYRIFSVSGLGVAFLALSALTVIGWFGLGTVPIAITLGVMGLGLGMTTPSLTVALQNAVTPDQIGVATATSTFIRSLGNAFGVGIAGAIITHFVSDAPHDGDHGSAVSALLNQGTQALAGASGEARQLVLESYRDGISLTFGSAALMAALGFIIILRLKDKPLRDTTGPDAS